jgi:predicted aminopeptidase
LFNWLAIFSLVSASGCAQISYYNQAVNGHLEIVKRVKPIDEVIASPTISPQLRQQLNTAKEIRRFAIESLHLPDNASYTQFADLQRKFVVWNVYAAPRFALTPKLWCFPIVGCLSYRGYFSPEPANAEANQLKQQGFDVYVTGIRAYSTLGWFADPLLNTMFSQESWQLAALIFHELSHQLIYVSDDSTFNESFASTVEEIGVKKWLEKQGTPQQFSQYLISKQRNQQMITLVLTAKTKLEKLYQQTLPESEMLAQKNAILNTLQLDYQTLKETQWNHYRGYDYWFADLNNAKLLSVAMYEEFVPAFQRLFEQSGGNILDFYAQVHDLAGFPKRERDQKLVELQQNVPLTN